jgi:hypothetical protein
MHKYTAEQVEFITRNVKGITSYELTQRFNNQFGLDITIAKIRAFIKNHNLTSGVDARFQKNHVPVNKGVKGAGGWEPTQFKKGHRPHNYMPVGTERVNGDGYVDIKIADPKKWRAKHVLIWEEANGPLPRGHVVIFGDGNKRNFDINNLILVSRAQLAILNHNGMIQQDADLTRTAIIIADISSKISKRTKKDLKLGGGKCKSLVKTNSQPQHIGKYRGGSTRNT